MNTRIGKKRFGRVKGTALGLVFLVMALATGFTSCGAAADCENFQARVDDVPLVVFLLDVSTNNPDTLNSMARTVSSELTATALRDGITIRVLASGGDDTEIVTPPCFDGSTAYQVKRNNPGREKKDQEKARKVISEELISSLNEVDTKKTGTATRLLASAPRAVSAEGTGDVRVVVWSDLLGKTDNASDCLDLDGSVASQDYARQLVDTCYKSGQLRRFSADSVEFLQVGTRARTNEQILMSNYVVSEICSHIGGTCRVTMAK